MTKFEMRSRDFSEFTVGTLASLTAGVIPTKIDGSRTQGCSIEKLRWSADWLGKTAGVGEGPLAFGLSYDCTIAEIAAFYAADPDGQDAELELARSQLPILELGRIGQSQISGLENPIIATRNASWPGWPIREGKALSHYMFNANPADPMATGMTFQLYTECYGEWRQD